MNPRPLPRLLLACLLLGQGAGTVGALSYWLAFKFPLPSFDWLAAEAVMNGVWLGLSLMPFAVVRWAIDSSQPEGRPFSLDWWFGAVGWGVVYLMLTGGLAAFASVFDPFLTWSWLILMFTFPLSVALWERIAPTLSWPVVSRRGEIK